LKVCVSANARALPSRTVNVSARTNFFIASLSAGGLTQEPWGHAGTDIMA
jgi:hypothetical protein